MSTISGEELRKARARDLCLEANACQNGPVLLLDHVSITVPDLNAVRGFYDAVMSALSAVKVYDREDALGYGERARSHDQLPTYLAVYSSADAVPDARRHWCFKAQSIDVVRRFHAAGLANAGSDGGASGLRPNYHASYYGAFLVDPAGNRIEAVYHGASDEP